MIKAALFDLDGVVFDTETQYTQFWGSQFRLYFPNQDGLEQKIKGMTLVQLYEQYFPDQKEEQKLITQRLNDFEQKMSYNYIPGFESFIQSLGEAGVKRAVVTSSNREKMENVYRKHPEFKHYFEAILTSEDFERSKPDPCCYLKAASVFEVDPKECAGFEDSLNGLRAVRAARMLTVGLSTTNPHELIVPLADAVVADFTHLSLSQINVWYDNTK